MVPVIRVKTVEDAIDHCNANNLALQVSVGALVLEELSCDLVNTPRMSGMFTMAGGRPAEGTLREVLQLIWPASIRVVGPELQGASSV